MQISGGRQGTQSRFARVCLDAGRAYVCSVFEAVERRQKIVRYEAELALFTVSKQLGFAGLTNDMTHG